MKMIECCEETPEARPTFAELKDYLISLYNEKLRYYENDIRLKDHLPQLQERAGNSCIHSLYAMPEAINEPANDTATAENNLGVEGSGAEES
jgi:hypothetical protein